MLPQLLAAWEYQADIRIISHLNGAQGHKTAELQLLVSQIPGSRLDFGAHRRLSVEFCMRPFLLLCDQLHTQRRRNSSVRVCLAVCAPQTGRNVGRNTWSWSQIDGDFDEEANKVSRRISWAMSGTGRGCLCGASWLGLRPGPCAAQRAVSQHWVVLACAKPLRYVGAHETKRGAEEVNRRSWLWHEQSAPACKDLNSAWTTPLVAFARVSMGRGVRARLRAWHQSDSET